MSFSTRFTYSIPLLQLQHLAYQWSIRDQSSNLNIFISKYVLLMLKIVWNFQNFFITFCIILIKYLHQLLTTSNGCDNKRKAICIFTHITSALRPFSFGFSICKHDPFSCAFSFTFHSLTTFYLAFFLSFGIFSSGCV